MSNFVQTHQLTFYPPSNLNRDDLGQPKMTTIGGTPRLRISSQCLKRTVRTSEVFQRALEGRLGQRTQRLGEEVHKHLIDGGMAEEKAATTAREIAGVFGKLKPEKDDNPTRIEQLAFVSPMERQTAFALADKALAGKKIDVKPTEILTKVDTAADIAMFGRMLADNPEYNWEAAVQVAHAFTTHRAVVEDDYYTAVDDLKTAAEDAGAGFIGEAGFGSGLFYTYSCINTDLMLRNLGGNEGVAKDSIVGLIEAMATVTPTGKQSSYASRAYADYLMIEKGSQQPRTLATAFARAVTGDDIVAASVDALEERQRNMDEQYGPCADARFTMRVGGNGTLAEALMFAVNHD
jgi:CRISPR system Cascade subunit CasC